MSDSYRKSTKDKNRGFNKQSNKKEKKRMNNKLRSGRWDEFD